MTIQRRPVKIIHIEEKLARVCDSVEEACKLFYIGGKANTMTNAIHNVARSLKNRTIIYNHYLVIHQEYTKTGKLKKQKNKIVRIIDTVGKSEKIFLSIREASKFFYQIKKTTHEDTARPSIGKSIKGKKIFYSQFLAEPIEIKYTILIVPKSEIPKIEKMYKKKIVEK